MNVGFTGTRNLGVHDINVIRKVMRSLDIDDRVIVGGCVGADAAVAEIAWDGDGGDLRVHVILPANRKQVDPRWRDHCHTFEQMPPGTDYRDRNRRLVGQSDRLVAFAEYPEMHRRSTRSGTWMTVRLARAAGVPVELHIFHEE